MFNIIEFSDELNRVVEDSILLQEYIKKFDELNDKYAKLKKEKDRLEKELERVRSVDSRELEEVEKKGKAFDEIVGILCGDGVEFRQEMEKEDVVVDFKGEKRKIGECVLEWKGLIEFGRVREFERFVEVIVEGMGK